MPDLPYNGLVDQVAKFTLEDNDFANRFFSLREGLPLDQGRVAVLVTHFGVGDV